MPRSIVHLLLGAVLCGICAQSAVAAPAFYDGNSADGSTAVFSTKEQMVPGDTDQELDVYVREFDSGLGEYLTREVSIGPRGGNDAQPATFDGMSSDGNEVFFSTAEPMVPGDTDQAEDVYLRDLVQNRTVLVSQGSSGCAGQGCGNGAFAASFLPGGVAPDGGVVFFGSSERLESADQDNAFDVYVRDLGAETTRLVSAPDPSCVPCTGGELDAQFRGTDDSGSRAFFTTSEKLANADIDSGESDIYARDLAEGTTALVSVPGTCPPDLSVGQNCEPSYGGASADGSHVFFETNDRVLPVADTDKSQDIYDWSEGAVALTSTGPDGGNGDFNVTFAGTTPNGGAAFFETSESLLSADADSAQDVYQRLGGTTSLVSAGEAGKGNLAVPASFEWVSLSGPHLVAFTTAEPLVAEDADFSQDVYLRSGGTTTLISVGPDGGEGEFSAIFAGAADDGSKIFFTTAEPLVAEDADSSQDVYMRSGGETTLVSGGQVGGNGPFSAGLRGVSTTGSRAFFTTQERLTFDDDFAGEQDVYGWTESGTLLVSVKNSPDLVIGPPPPALEKTNPTSPNPSTTPAIVGQAAAGSLVKVYKTADCSGEPVAQGTATQLSSPGLTVTVPVAPGSTTSYRATAESEGVVSVCSSAITYKQEDPPPPPTEEGSGGGGGGSGGETPTGGGTGGTGTKPGGKTPGGGKNGIVYVVPQLKITFGPAFKTRKRRPVFRFADLTGQPGTNFFCRVDKQPWKGCTSPTKVKKLKFGRHVFAVKAVNAVGTPAPRPLKRAFKVVRG
ncbi:MAG TPA: hypothetical protein VNC16_03840 [Solirubrobacterales bacterium]|jgi:hypothetical protein|nr:hypothetical protein [Solirubrobacterales bacterium]